MTLKKIYYAILLLLGGTAVFVLGNLYYDVFPTNRSRPYLIGLSLFLLIAALTLKRTRSQAHWWSAVYALFIASSATLFLEIGLYDLSRDPSNPLVYLAIDKFSQFLHVVPVILATV